ncbi:MAG: hypothetical protein Tsb0020_09650 [Haliangiales bacterium]
MFTRFVCYAGAAILTAGISAGCGDDGDPGGTPDAMPDPADAMPGAADAAPDANPCDENAGHGSGCVDTPFALAEGGEVRLERFQTSEAGTEDLLAAQAFFFKGQTPSFRPLDGTPITIRAELADKGIACSDFRAGNLFDNGFSAAAQTVVDTRTYYDVGDVVTLTNETDGTDVITLTEETDTVDNSALLNHDTIYLAPADTTPVTLGATYVPALDGNSLDYPSLDLGYGQSVAGDMLADANGEGTPKIYMPEGFTATSPTETELYAGLTVTKGEDLIIDYDVANAEPADWPGIITFIGFINPTNQAEFVCFNPPTEEGTFTVPYEIFDEDINVEDGSYIILGRFTHAAWEYIQDNTRVDLIGIECKVLPQFDIADATTGSN